MTRIRILLCAFIVLLVTSLPLHINAADRWKEDNEKIGDIKIHYLEAGSGERALILIPGWTMPAEVWKEQIPYFSARGFRVIALDPRSQGRTSKKDSQNTYHQQAIDLNAFLDKLEIDQFSLVGWGSGIAAILEYTHSSETYPPEKIVFVDGSPAGLESDDYPGSTPVRQVRKLLYGLQDDRTKATEQYVRDLFKVRQPEWLINDLVKDSMRTPIGAAVSLYMDYFLGDRRSALRNIAVPCLIMTTTEGRAIGEYMESKILRPELKVIEGTGSAMFLDKPQTFNQILEDFLGVY
jgi:microsomal epoxide hydrolase